MQWRVVVELSGVAGAVRGHEVHTGGSTMTGWPAPTLGLTLAEAEAVLAGLQRHPVPAGANGRALSDPTALRAMWRTAASDGPASAAVDFSVRHGRGSNPAPCCKMSSRSAIRRRQIPSCSAPCRLARGRSAGRLRHRRPRRWQRRRRLLQRRRGAQGGWCVAGVETDVAGQAALIIDDAAARHGEEPISTAPTEATVQWLLHRQMGASQQMRWSPRRAHLMLRVRTAVANGTFDRDHVVAERWARRPFHHPT